MERKLIANFSDISLLISDIFQATKSIWFQLLKCEDLQPFFVIYDNWQLHCTASAQYFVPHLEPVLMSEKFTKAHANAGIMDFDICLVFIRIFLVLNRRQLDLFQFVGDISPLTQEASSVLLNWGPSKDTPTQGLKPATPPNKLKQVQLHKIQHLHHDLDEFHQHSSTW